MQSKPRSHRLLRRLLTALTLFVLTPALPAVAGDPPAAAADPTVVRVGAATLRWHLDAAPEKAAPSPLVAEYRQLLTARFTGEEVPPAAPPTVETLAGGERQVRVPASSIHTLFTVPGDSPASGGNFCAKAGQIDPGTSAASRGEGR